MKLQEQLWSVVKEYTRQVADLLDVSPRDVHWIGTDDEGRGTYTTCDLGDTMFLSLDEMQVIIDNLPKWQQRYAPGKSADEQREAVADQIREWNDWSLEDGNLIDGHPRINLEHWLLGAPRTSQQPSPYSQLLDEIIQTEADIATLDRMLDEYGEDTSIWKIRNTKRRALEELERKRDDMQAADIERMKQSPEYKTLVECIENDKKNQETY